MVLKWFGRREGMRRAMASTSLCHLTRLECFHAQLALYGTAVHCLLSLTGRSSSQRIPSRSRARGGMAPTPLLYPVEWKWNHPACTPSGKNSWRLFDPVQTEHSNSRTLRGESPSKASTLGLGVPPCHQIIWE